MGQKRPKVPAPFRTIASLACQGRCASTPFARQREAGDESFQPSTTWKPPPRIFAIRIRRLSLVHALPPGGAGAGSVLRAHMRHEGAHVFVRGGARKVCVVVRYLRCVSCAQPSHSHLALAVLASIVCSCWSDRLRIGSDVAQSARTTRIISLIRKTQSPAVMAASSV